ncbi:MAG TPA: hypothetical protein PLL26_02850 [Candidatus Dojkabacteria bacterium]|nr:hypothetical protein [Candidatus Dojkabacteria bacterium]
MKKVIRIVQDELREMSKTERREFEAEQERLKSLYKMGKPKGWDYLKISPI